ncbi:MAG: hypothetical protein QE263_06355 [Vampirovibrionales bacterium]|nr:hypothetical protein [Vampirovibrionales bacterium]
MTSSLNNASFNNSANNALLAQWLLSSQAASASQHRVVEGNRIPSYLLQSSFGTVEGGTGEYNPKDFGWGDFQNPKDIIKAGEDTTFGNGNKVVDLYGEAFLKPETIRKRTTELADGVFNGTAIPITGKITNLSSVFNTGDDKYLAMPYISPLGNSTISNAFSTFVFSTVVGSLLTGQPNPLTASMLTNNLFGFADGDKYQNAFLTNSLGAKPPLESLTAASLNAKVLSDLGQSPLNQSVQEFISGTDSGIPSTVSSNTTSSAANASDAELLALLSNSATSSTAAATAIPAATDSVSAETTASVVYGDMLSASQVGMMSETSNWLKQYQAANGTGSSAGIGSLPSATPATAAVTTTSTATGIDANKLADATQWIRQLSVLGVDAERAKRLALQKLLAPDTTDYTLKVPSTGPNLNAETLQSLIQSTTQTTVQQTLQSVFKTILPKLQQLVYYWSQHPPSTTTSDTTTDDHSDSVSDNTT